MSLRILKLRIVDYIVEHSNESRSLVFKFETLIKIPSLELVDAKRRDQNRPVVQQDGHQGAPAVTTEQKLS